MSLHNTVCNKPRPVYKCIESLEKSLKDIMGHPSIDKGSVLDDFHLSWEYQIDYVEKRVPKHLIDNHFKLLT